MVSVYFIGRETQMLIKPDYPFFLVYFTFSFHSHYSLLPTSNKPKMQSMLNLSANHGVPLCLSGITNPLALSKEIADHDRRRKAMRKQRSLAREGVHANQEFIGTQRNFIVEIKVEEGGDLDDILYYLSLSHLDLTAKAA